MKIASIVTTISIGMVAIIVIAATTASAAVVSRKVDAPMMNREVVTVAVPLRAQAKIQAHAIMSDPNLRNSLKDMGRMGSVLPQFKNASGERFVTILGSGDGTSSTIGGTFSGVVTDVIVGADGMVRALLGRGLMNKGKGAVEGNFMVNFPNMGVGKNVTVVDIWSKPFQTCMYNQAGKFLYGTQDCPGNQPSPGKDVDIRENWPESLGRRAVDEAADMTNQYVTGESVPTDTDEVGDQDDDAIDDDDFGDAGNYDWDEDETDDEDELPLPDGDWQGDPRSRSIDRLAELKYFAGKTMFVTITTDVTGRASVIFDPEGEPGDGPGGVGPVARGAVEAISPVSTANVFMCPTTPKGAGPGTDPVPVARGTAVAGRGSVSFGGVCGTGGNPFPINLDQFNVK